MHSPLELWGGVECTVNRVGEAFHNQLRASGHDGRIKDLDRFAELGFKRFRYPVLWELTAPDQPRLFDWRWADERLPRLRDLGLQPIVGLLHHGSGPRYTDLLDARFADEFAAYAHAVAIRFPWVDSYTPINEPLTTARFSALYGHWHPHHRSDASFVRALLNQCRATVLAMRAIRDVNPDAQLVQTDDVGRTTSTPTLSYQAEFENERRWLGWDLLCGRVDRDHALWSMLERSGASVAELEWFEEHACPPDIIGVNHYVTSDRYLDENVDRFPRWSWGGNGRHAYADIEAARGLASGFPGIQAALADAWSRYQLPIAITEAHLGCTREEQLRWLREFWLAAHEARAQGVDVRAVTMWAVLGSFDWNSLVTTMRGCYEPGAFDVRGRSPRPTALAAVIQELTGSAPSARPFLDQPGWWRRSSRLFSTLPNLPPEPPRTSSGSHRPLLITGATGTLGRAFARVCEARGLDARVCTRAELDICSEPSIARALDELRPWAVINAAGYVRVDDAERECERCYLENAQGPALLAAACADRKTPLVTFSSDLVFDGASSTPYVESHPAAPLNVYGLSKARAEREVLRAHPGALVVRTSSFFGPWDEHNFVTIALRALRAGREFFASDDLIVSPTYVPDLVNTSLDLLIDGESGLWHLINEGGVSWAELARRAAECARIDASPLKPCSWRSLGLTAVRPSFSALTSERGLIMPTLEHALERYIAAA